MSIFDGRFRIWASARGSLDQNRALLLSLAVALANVAATELAAQRPDLSGTWDFRTDTPLERPDEKGRATLAERRAARDAAGGRTPVRSVWPDAGTASPEDRRTSLIVDPPEGRLPELVAGARRQDPDDPLPEDGVVRIRVGGLGTDNVEERGLAERCLQGFNSGPPIVPGYYNQNLRIVQTDDQVLLLNEMIHDARAVRLGGEHPPPEQVRWMGDSVGRWEGDTLVVDTRNFPSRVASFAPTPFVSIGSAEQLHLTERLRLLDPNTLEYRFTVDDPGTFVRPFTAVLLMTRTEHKLYEYACHEGNKPLRHILMMAREVDDEAPGEDAPER